MPKLVLPPRARRDINAILIYIAHQGGSAEIGLNFAKLLRDQCAQLASLPGTLGRPRPELGTEIRSLAVRGYVIYFRYAPGVLRIITVLEGHRDTAAHFQNDPA